MGSRAPACLAFGAGALVMRDFMLRVFAASGADTSAGATTLTVNTKSNSVAFKRLISSIGTGCAILFPLRSTNRRPPSRGAATMGKSSLPSFTMRERIWRVYGFCRFLKITYPKTSASGTKRKSAAATSHELNQSAVRGCARLQSAGRSKAPRHMPRFASRASVSASV